MIPISLNVSRCHAYRERFDQTLLSLKQYERRVERSREKTRIAWSALREQVGFDQSLDSGLGEV